MARPAEPKPLPTAYLPGLVEIVQADSPAFLMVDGDFHFEIEQDDRVLIPHPDCAKLFGPPIPVGQILMHKTDIPARLLRDIEAFIVRHVELPAELPPLIVALHILESYLQELARVLPYLYVSGPYGSGKSWLLEVLAALAWRPLFTTSLTPAAIYRTVEVWWPTLLVDEFGTSRELDGDIHAVLNCRYRDGASIIRCRAKSFEAETFRVFGPTAIAGPRIQRSLATRSLSGVMAKSSRTLPRRIDKDEAQSLRARLLAFRMKALEDGS